MRILITGASSGLGTALALAYAKPGNTIYLGGRNHPRLQIVADHCTKAGAEARPACVDVTNPKEMTDWITPLQQKQPLDLIIANAGISGGTAEDGIESDQQVRDILRTNVEGVVNTISPALPAMQTAKHGQIAIISSIAGFRGFPGAPAYCASKGAVRLYGEALRGLLKADGISVSVVCPGYIKTPMTDANNFSMPLMIDSEKAADIIRKGLAKNKARIAFPWLLYSVVWWLSLLPAGLTDRLLARLPRKNSLPEQGTP